MSKSVPPSKSTRNRYSPAFKQEALALADRVGAAEAARQLGLQATQLYVWRSKAQQENSVDTRTRELDAENARLRRLLAEQTEDLAIL
jgi:transposase